jgi:transcription initiation factor TFIIIB Brf1 subunit/transcription initiation factor TFIIB
MSDRLTKKKKATKSKKELWAQIEDNFIDKEPIECVYRMEGERETCDICKFSVRMTEDGFLACSNPKCSVIYKDMVDQSAEWRYYGADDNQNSDPTRCGMPVNPLLKESSYGCKVICQGATSYEMRKIRRYTEWQSML